MCSKVLVTARGAGGGEGSKIRLLDDHVCSLPFKTKQLHTPKVGPIPPAHDPLEPFAYINNTMHPHTFASTHDFIQITNTQHTRRRGGCQYFSTTIAVPKLVFFHTPPFIPNYRKFPTRPPVLLIKVVPHPPLSPGLVMVSAKVMVRPPNFGGENPQKSQKDEKKIGGPNF